MGGCFPYVPHFATEIRQSIQEKKNMEEKILVIHPIESGFDDLDLLYYDLDVDFDDDITGKVKLRRDVIEHRKIMLLGSGNENGLRAPLTRINVKRSKQFIGPDYAQFLRDKEVIGIFENSKLFAAKYKLTGLFMGEVLFDSEKALREFFHSTQSLLDQHKYEWCLDLGYLVRNRPWYIVQDEMMKLGQIKTPLERLNYSTFVYMVKGHDIKETV